MMMNVLTSNYLDASAWMACTTQEYVTADGESICQPHQ